MLKNLFVASISLFFLPQLVFADVYNIDPVHSHVGFSVKHMVISNVRGKFNTFAGTFETDEKGNIKNVLLEIETVSIDTDHEKRDTHLRSPDFFDVQKFPKLTFKYKKTTYRNGAHYKVLGDLTLHGITKEVLLNMELLGKAKDPWGNYRVGITGNAEINRKDFGLVWNKTLETGGILVGEIIRISLEVEAILEK